MEGCGVLSGNRVCLIGHYSSGQMLETWQWVFFWAQEKVFIKSTYKNLSYLNFSRFRSKSVGLDSAGQWFSVIGTLVGGGQKKVNPRQLVFRAFDQSGIYRIPRFCSGQVDERERGCKYTYLWMTPRSRIKYAMKSERKERLRANASRFAIWVYLRELMSISDYSYENVKFNHQRIRWLGRCQVIRIRGPNYV